MKKPAIVRLNTLPGFEKALDIYFFDVKTRNVFSILTGKNLGGEITQSGDIFFRLWNEKSVIAKGGRQRTRAYLFEVEAMVKRHLEAKGFNFFV